MKGEPFEKTYEFDVRVTSSDTESNVLDWLERALLYWLPSAVVEPKGSKKHRAKIKKKAAKKPWRSGKSAEVHG